MISKRLFPCRRENATFWKQARALTLQSVAVRDGRCLYTCVCLSSSQSHTANCWLGMCTTTSLIKELMFKTLASARGTIWNWILLQFTAVKVLTIRVFLTIFSCLFLRRHDNRCFCSAHTPVEEMLLFLLSAVQTWSFFLIFCRSEWLLLSAEETF